ncbi:MAG TPA: DNA helicase RecQ [Mesorhizobium sp.]|jgi:ATP-dependent DNA helicase RecQ|nr:DNA helicase RecQ [Mesorhizobium sp.]
MLNKAAPSADHQGGRNPHDVLQSVFGYSAFRGEQEQIVRHVMEGGSALVLMPTGSGKSLCYQIPALCRDGVGIVVSPLIALMDDQVTALRQLGVRAAAIHSGLDSAVIRATKRRLRDGDLDLLYVAPERVLMEDFLNTLEEVEIALFAIDEAHCISQWGHDFRPEYRQLSALRERFPHVSCLAVTATADGPTRREIAERLKLPTVFTAGFDRPNIAYVVTPKENPRDQLVRFLKSRAAGESGIVYCLSRKRVEETAALLVREGFRALPYHAGLDSDVRAANQSRFLKEDGVIMVATVAFGMGINKPDVRFVAHMDLPKSIEAYYQETGRAGRDGLPATAWMVYGLADVVTLRQMIEASDAPDRQKRVERGKLDMFLSFCEAARCRRQTLLNHFGDSCEPCGNCDTCQVAPKTFDATVAAQKALSCVLRTGERFGAVYVIDVLLGRDDERMRRLGHHTLSTFGIGQEHSERAWRSILRQLVVHDLLQVDMDRHGGMRLTDEGRAFLKERRALQLRLDDRPAAKAKALSRVPKPAPELHSDADVELLRQLKAERTAIAREQGVPPYVIFHDRTLIEMANRRPTTLQEFGTITGVGQVKVERYGQRFLDLMGAA